MSEQPKSKLMARLRARRRRDGLVRVEVWVQRDKAELMRTYASNLNSSPGEEDGPWAEGWENRSIEPGMPLWMCQQCGTRNDARDEKCPYCLAPANNKQQSRNSAAKVR